jgi:hypothetical protein
MGDNDYDCLKNFIYDSSSDDLEHFSGDIDTVGGIDDLKKKRNKHKREHPKMFPFEVKFVNSISHNQHSLSLLVSIRILNLNLKSTTAIKKTTKKKEKKIICV